MTAAPFRVLTVCVGNICRSPLAERLLALRLAELGLADAVAVTSAGTYGVVGHAMDRLAAAELVRLGGDPEGFAARRLQGDHLEDADLVLTATRDIRREALGLLPRAMRRTFTLPEFAAICAASGEPRDLPELVEFATANRHLAQGVEQDIADPIGRDEAVHRAVADQVASCVDLVIAAIRPSGGHQSSTVR